MPVSSYLSIHNATKIVASAHADLASAPLMIHFEGEDWAHGAAEIIIHTDNAELTLALVDAINNAVASVKAKQSELEAA